MVSPVRQVPDSIVKPPYLSPGSPRSPADGFPPHEFGINTGDPKHIEIKRPEDIEGMRKAGALARETLLLAGSLVKPGVTTESIDAAVHDFVVSRGAYPSPLGYLGYPKAVCTSLNDVIAHGIPDDRELQDGDILNIDVTVYLNGYHGDTSSMFFAGQPSRSAISLCNAAQRATMAGIKVCGPGVDFREIGAAITAVSDDARCYCCGLLVGHGIGKYFHGKPEVIPNVNNVDQGVMKPGMTFTVEPVLVENNDPTWFIESDLWTLRTKTGAWTAQFEHTVLITETGHEILTGPSIDYVALAAKQAGGAAFAARPSTGFGGGDDESGPRTARRPSNGRRAGASGFS